ncbi:MAG TPA: FN3 associated domain-containing protein, partial [Spirochaetota bacterium]|nr:FN3 associated domain-containing protein [Spirochaetota bacterium]
INSTTDVTIDTDQTTDFNVYKTVIKIPKKYNGEILENVKLIYTLDGSEPTRSNGITVSKDETIDIKNDVGSITKKTFLIKAMLFKGEWIDSKIVTKNLSVTGKINKPDIDYTAITSSEPVRITLSCKNSGAEIYYTKDGTEPTKTNGIRYRGVITLTESLTFPIKTKAYLNEWESSDVFEKGPFKVTGIYDIDSIWSDETIQNGQLNEPTFLAFDSSNNVCVLDKQGLSRFDTNCTFKSRLLNSLYLDNIGSLCLDSSGNIYILNINPVNPQIEKFDNTFNSNTVLVSNVYRSLAIDSNNRLYSITGDYKIGIYNNSGASIKTIGGGVGTTSGKFALNGKTFLAIDNSTNNIYSCDTSSDLVRLQRFVYDTGAVNLSFSSYVKDGVTYNLKDFGKVSKITCNSNYFIISFIEESIATIFYSLVFDKDGNFIHELKFTRGVSNGQFDHGSYYDVIIDSNNYLYITDTWNSRVQKLKINGYFISTIGEKFIDKQFKYPQSLWVDRASDHVYVADKDHHVIRVFDGDGVYKKTIGKQGSGKGEFFKVVGVITDNSGDIYGVDYKGNRVHKFNSQGEFLFSLDNIIDSNPYNFGAGEAMGLICDSKNNFYFYNQENILRKFDRNGNLLWEKTNYSLNGVTYGFYCECPQRSLIGIDSKDNIYLINYSDLYSNLKKNKVIVFDSDLNYKREFDLIYNSADISYMYIDTNDYIYFSYNGKIAKYKTDGTLVSENIGNTTGGAIAVNSYG